LISKTSAFLNLPCGGEEIPKAELARADVGCQRSWPELLKKHDLQETEASIANKISRGTFSATFLLVALMAIGAETVRLEDI
jgi:hypothetical protein